MPNRVQFSLSFSSLAFILAYKDFVDDDAFKDALHIIDNIGQNDFAGSFEYLSYVQVIKKRNIFHRRNQLCYAGTLQSLFTSNGFLSPLKCCSHNFQFNSNVEYISTWWKELLGTRYGASGLPSKKACCLRPKS